MLLSAAHLLIAVMIKREDHELNDNDEKLMQLAS
jgi:hypothetical protein